MKNTFSVLILNDDGDLGLFAAHSLARFPNVRVHILSREQWPPLRVSRYRQSYTFSPVGYENRIVLEIIENVVKKKRIDVLLPVDIQGIRFVIANREALSSFVAIAPVPYLDSFEVVNNKWLLAKFLEEKQMPGPPTLLIDYNDSFEKQLQALEFPVLVKPIILSSDGDGIKKFGNLPELRHFLEHQNPEQLRGQLIIQSFLSGYTLGVNILSRNGKLLAITLQHWLIPDEREFAPAAAVKFIKDDRFFAMAQKLVSALNWNGYANLDTICDSQNNLRVVDFNSRFWGSLLGSYEAGVSFPYLACLVALNIPFPMPDYDPIKYFHIKTALREMRLGFLGKRQEYKVNFRESGLRFLLADPLAELMRIYKKKLFGKFKNA